MIASNATGGRWYRLRLFGRATILAAGPDGDRARAGRFRRSKHHRRRQAICSRGTDSKIAPSPGSRITARDLSLANDSEHPSPPPWFDKLLVKIVHTSEQFGIVVEFFFGKLWPRGWTSLVNENRGGRATQDLRLWANASRDFDSRAGGVSLLVRQQGIASFPSARSRASTIPVLVDSVCCE